MINKIDVSNPEYVSYTYDSSYRYPIVSESARKRLQQWLKSEYQISDVNAINSQSLSWKESSYSDEAQTHERIFGARNCLDIRTSPRNGNLSGRDPRGDEIQIAQDLHLLSVRFLEKHWGNDINMYRGIGHGLPQIAVQIIDYPNRTSHSLTVSTLSNFTTSQATAEYFSSAILERRLPVDAVAIASDHIFPYITDNGIEKTHGELRVRGDYLQPIPVNRVKARYTTRPLTELFSNPTNITSDEHQVIAAIVERISESGKKISTSHGKSTIRDWIKSYTTVDPMAATAVKSDIDAICQ